ncbi:MAG: InlB B-repeat-containing protein, partial [Ruminococcus sp.]
MKMRKILAFIIALAMCISVFPVQIFAVDYDGVEFTALYGTGEDGENQNYAKAFDAKQSTKWCDKIGTISGKTYTPYVIFKASKRVIITDYTFITANDNASYNGRNPKDWTLYGCNDYNEANKSGGTWTAIDTVTDDAVMQDKNYTPYTFTIENNNRMYQYYKIEITANHGALYNLIQLSEIQLGWNVAYYVTFDKNGGDAEASPQIIKLGEGLPTTNPTRTGYKFLGWYTKNGTDGDWGEEFTADSTVSEDITVYAKWEKLYWVTFDLNGGTAESIDKIYHGEPLPTEIPTKADVKFGGWFTKNGTETGDWGEQYSLDTVVTEDITVYAKWNSVNITFDKNGGDVDSNPSIISSGEPLPTVNPTYNGYKFLGWFTKDGADGDWGEQFTQEMSDAAIADITVYAKWELVTITFDNNNWETEGNNTQLPYGQLPESNPTMVGFTFNGWYTKNGMSTGDWGEKYPDEAAINADTTVYAKWTATDKDCLDAVTITAITGTAGNSGESYDKLFDGKKIAGYFSKWCVSSFTKAEVIFKTSAYTIPLGYTL